MTEAQGITIIEHLERIDFLAHSIALSTGFLVGYCMAMIFLRAIKIRRDL